MQPLLPATPRIPAALPRFQRSAGFLAAGAPPRPRFHAGESLCHSPCQCVSCSSFPSDDSFFKVHFALLAICSCCVGLSGCCPVYTHPATVPVPARLRTVCHVLTLVGGYLSRNALFSCESQFWYLPFFLHAVHSRTVKRNFKKYFIFELCVV